MLALLLLLLAQLEEPPPPPLPWEADEQITAPPYVAPYEYVPPDPSVTIPASNPAPAPLKSVGDMLNPILFTTSTDNGDGTTTYRTYNKPVNYLNAEGVLTPISTESQATTYDGKTAYTSDTNVLQTKVNLDGKVRMALDHYEVVMWPKYLSTDNLAEANRVLGSRLTDISKFDARTIKVTDCFPGMDAYYRLQAGALKEVIRARAIVKSRIPVAANYVLIAWDYTSSLTPQAINGNTSIAWLDNDGNRILETAPIVMKDANGERTTGQYVVRQGFVIMALPAAWMRAATYPVDIDPTITTFTDISSLRSGLHNYYKMFVKFTLPTFDITPTFSAATFKVYCNDASDESTGTTVSTYCFDDETNLWSTGSNATTMNAVATSKGTATDSGDTIDYFSTWYTLNIVGDAAKGLTKVYADDSGAPGSCTVLVEYNSGTGATTTTSSLELGDDTGLDWKDFDAVTNTPYIEYTVSNGAVIVGNTRPRTGGFSAGVQQY